MNVERSTFVRRGYLLTALAVAVLLAGSSGTAWAQTITASSRFTRSSGTLEEGASVTDPATPDPLKVTIRRSTKTKNDPYNATGGGDQLLIEFEYDGDDYVPSGTAPFTVTATEGSTTNNLLTITAAGVGLRFGDSGDDRDEGTEEAPVPVDIAEDEIELTIAAVADNGDWDPEKLVLTLSKGPALAAENVRDFTSKLTVTITDDDPKPKLNFAETDIQLAKENTKTVKVGMGVGAGGEGDLPGDTGDAATGANASIHGKLESLNGTDAGRGESLDRILLSVSPPDAVGPPDTDRGIISISVVGAEPLELDSQGRYNIGTIAEAVSADGIVLQITAKEVSGFRDEMIRLMLMEGRTEARIAADGGAIDDADPATVSVLSGAETPTVTFSTESIDIDEGESKSVHLLASGMQGDQVGSAAVRVRGEASISLEQDGNPVAGSVSFGGNANAELTIIANSDPSLEDGEEKTATVTITDASGANIGDPRAVTVTVVGSTAVPVLPLFAQLLLALLLMVGGARLYRRRQG